MSEEIINVPMAQQRDIRTVTTEIRTITQQAQRMALEYAIEIGRRLCEAKTMLSHGEWGSWLKDEVEFSQSSANNFMKIFDEYGADQIGIFGAEAKSQAIGKLSYTKALRLLAIPSEEREAFARNVDAEHLSSRELEEKIKAALAERDKACENMDNMADDLSDAKRERDEAQQQADVLKIHSLERGSETGERTTSNHLL